MSFIYVATCVCIVIATYQTLKLVRYSYAHIACVHSCISQTVNRLFKSPAS